MAEKRGTMEEKAGRFYPALQRSFAEEHQSQALLIPNHGPTGAVSGPFRVDKGFGPLRCR